MTEKTTRREAMRQAAALPLAAGLGLSAGPSAGSTEKVGGNGKILVVFLSRSGNTRVIAGQVQRAHSADLFEIRTATPYPADYLEMVAAAQRHRDAGTAPPLAESVRSVAGYRTVFLGFPIWGMALPAPVRTFLKTHDLTGKTIVPFITHGGYGPGSAPETLATLAPGARILPPFVLRRDQERDTLEPVKGWLGSVEPQL